MTEKQRRRQHRQEQLAKRKAAEAAKPKPRVDALERAVAGTSLAGALDRPTTDPLWQSEADSAERRRIMKEVEIWENARQFGCIMGPATNHISVHGSTLPLADFVEWQSWNTYNMLKHGCDVRAVAATVYRHIEWVDALAAKFNLHKPL